MRKAVNKARKKPIENQMGIIKKAKSEPKAFMYYMKILLQKQPTKVNKRYSTHTWKH